MISILNFPSKFLLNSVHIVIKSYLSTELKNFSEKVEKESAIRLSRSIMAIQRNSSAGKKRKG